MIIAAIIGVRPQFVKAAVLSPVIRKEHKEILIHTGQHYDDNMSAVFFRELGLPQPDYVLDGNGGACAGEDRVECMTGALVSVLQKEPVDAVLLYGDTASTLAGALAAGRVKVPAIHVEAGERNGLVNSPEEKIRKRVDQLSSLLLCCTEQAVANLQAEGLGDRAHFIGNLMELSFLKNVSKPWKPGLVRLTEPAGQVISVPRKFYLLTCHRQENANEKNITEILLAMEQAKYPVIFPVHPRNRERVLRIYGEILRRKGAAQTETNRLCCDCGAGVSEPEIGNIILTEPAGYFDSIHLIKNAVAVVTDSGGVLQEAHFAQTPYVFVMDIAKVPDNTRFDVGRLARPEHNDILRKLEQKQVFDGNAGLLNEPADAALARFEDNVLGVLREFGKKIGK